MQQLVKPILTLLIGFALFMIGYSINGGSYNAILWIWIICGIPYGLPRICFWISMKNGDLGSTLAIFALNFILAGLIGGFIYIWTMCKAIFNILFFCFHRRSL